MRVLRLLPVLAFVIAPLLPAAQVKAEPDAHKPHLHTSGRVLPMQHIVIDEEGTIVEVLSNTNEDVMPKVYFKTITKENERPLTTALLEQYQALVPPGTSKPGVLYRKSILEMSLRVENDLTSLISPSTAPATRLAISVRL